MVDLPVKARLDSFEHAFIFEFTQLDGCWNARRWISSFIQRKYQPVALIGAVSVYRAKAGMRAHIEAVPVVISEAFPLGLPQRLLALRCIRIPQMPVEAET